MAVIFLGCVLFLLLLLPFLYYRAQKYLDNLHKEENTEEYIILPSSDESDEYIPTHTADVIKEEKRVKEENKTKVFASFQYQLIKAEEKSKPVKTKSEYTKVFRPLITQSKEDDSDTSLLEKSANFVTLGIQLAYILDKKKLFVKITNVEDIITYEYGGPEMIKFIIKLFENTSRKRKYKQKLSIEFTNVDNFYHNTQNFVNINEKLLLSLSLKISLFGMRKKTETLLGETFIRLKDLKLNEHDEVTLVRSILPVGETTINKKPLF